MADIKWIKITTDIFDDEKIKIIDTYPARDEIIVIWFKLLTLAGKSNSSGSLFLSNRIPYTIEMLSTIFNREVNVIQMALNVFVNFGMVDIQENETISIANWEKHQNVDGMEHVRELTKKRVSRHREKLKQLPTPDEHVTLHETLRNAIEEELDKESDKEKNKKKKDKPVKHKYGEYNNVLLSDEELEKLKSEFSDYKERIENLSVYMASKGKKYESHLATIRNWARKEQKEKCNAPGGISLW